MANTDLTTVQKRVNGLLLTNRVSPFSASVGTGESANSRYQDDNEIKTAILEADALIVLARISNVGDPFRPTFLTWANGLADGDDIPAFVGAVGHIDVDDGTGYGRARLFESAQEAIEVKANAALYPAAKRYAFIEGSRIFHNGTQARVRYPAFTKSSVCQSPEVDEFAVIAGSVSMLVKDGAALPELYGQLGQYFTAYLAMLKGENVTLPDIEHVERQLAA